MEDKNLCFCCIPLENGDYEPCCNYGGECTAHYLDSIRGNCIHCGAEMFEEEGNWYHHSQEYLHPSMRFKTHHKMPTPNR